MTAAGHAADRIGTPRVSVFIAAYNAEATLAEAIDSVLAQTWTDFELLIVDDGSGDETAAICRTYAQHDPRVRCIRLAHNQGRARARDIGLHEARGDYVAVLDADDRALNSRLARQLDFLAAHPEIDVLGTWSHSIDVAGQHLPPKTNQLRLSPDEVSCHLLFRCLIDNPTVMARTAAIRAYPFDPAFPVAEDYDVWERMRMQHRMALLPERLTEYRIHDRQASIARIADGWHYRRAIQARQLDALGMRYDERDLLYHHLLYSGRGMFARQTGQAMGADYAHWAADWFARLIQANRLSRRYPEPAFTRVLASLWGHVVAKTLRGGDMPRSLIAAGRSPLTYRWLGDRWRRRRHVR